MRAEFLVGVVVPSLAHKIKVKFRQKERKGVRIVVLDHFATLGVESNAITAGCRRKFADAGKHHLKKSFRAKFAHRKDFGLRLARGRTGRPAQEHEFGLRALWAEQAYRPAP